MGTAIANDAIGNPGQAYGCGPVIPGTHVLIKGRVKKLGTAEGGACLVARMQSDGSCYIAGPFDSDGWEIYRLNTVGGAPEEVAFVPDTYNDGDVFDLEYEIDGGNHELRANGVVVASGVSNVIPSGGRAGAYFTSYTDPTTAADGWQTLDFQAYGYP